MPREAAAGQWRCMLAGGRVPLSGERRLDPESRSWHAYAVIGDPFLFSLYASLNWCLIFCNTDSWVVRSEAFMWSIWWIRIPLRFLNINYFFTTSFRSAFVLHETTDASCLINPREVALIHNRCPRYPSEAAPIIMYIYIYCKNSMNTNSVVLISPFVNVCTYTPILWF